MPAYTKLTTAQLNALLSTTLGALKPYQIQQVQEVLDRVAFNRGSNAEVSVQPTISTIATSLSTNNP